MTLGRLAQSVSEQGALTPRLFCVIHSLHSELMNKYQKTVIRIVITVTAASFMAGSFVSADKNEPPLGDVAKNIPIFDAHIHYKKPAWDSYPVESIIELMDKNGVAMGLVSSTPDEGTIRLWRYAPGRIVPELRPYHGDVGSSNWAKAENMVKYLELRLLKHPHEGIGEFHIHRLDTSDEPLFREVIKLAKERDIFLHVHSDAEPIRWLYSLDSEVKLIWAHAGLGTPVTRVYEVLEEFPELVADLSLREYDILAASDQLDPEWGELLLAFQDRLLVGSDTWVNSQWADYSNIIDANRRWLAKLPREAAKKIAYQNAERLFNREISLKQIGTR